MSQSISTSNTHRILGGACGMLDDSRKGSNYLMWTSVCPFIRAASAETLSQSSLYAALMDRAAFGLHSTNMR